MHTEIAIYVLRADRSVKNFTKSLIIELSEKRPYCLSHSGAIAMDLVLSPFNVRRT